MWTTLQQWWHYNVAWRFMRTQHLQGLLERARLHVEEAGLLISQVVEKDEKIKRLEHEVVSLRCEIIGDVFDDRKVMVGADDIHKINVQPGDLIVLRTHGLNSFGVGVIALKNMRDELQRLAGGPVSVIALNETKIDHMSMQDVADLRRELDKAEETFAFADRS
jgi:hypothetical protein